MGLECSFATTLISIFNVNSHKESSGTGRHSCGLQKPAIATFSLALSAGQTQCGWLLCAGDPFSQHPWLQTDCISSHFPATIERYGLCTNASTEANCLVTPLSFSSDTLFVTPLKKKKKKLMRNTSPSPVIFPLTEERSKLAFENLQCVVWKKEAAFCGSIFSLCGQTG